MIEIETATLLRSRNVRQFVAESRASQGLPSAIEDACSLVRVLELFDGLYLVSRRKTPEDRAVLRSAQPMGARSGSGVNIGQRP